MPALTLPARCPEWVTAIGAWGDVFGACGNALTALKATGGRQVGVLYYGFDRDVWEFLDVQPWVREVRHLAPAGAKEYKRLTHTACAEPHRPETWLPAMLARLPGLAFDWQAEGAVWPAHVGHGLQQAPVIHRWQHAHLMPEAREGARAWRRRLSAARLYLLHPVSTQSCPLEAHWPHWVTAVRWLLAATPHAYLLTGHGYDGRAFGFHPRLVDLVGRTASMLEVLALAEVCDGLLTTSNSLSMWSVMQDLPAIVACNRHLSPGGYFHAWVDTPPNRLVPTHAPLSAFQAAVREMQG